MTDNEIIKGLNYCSNGQDCENCHFNKSGNCIDVVMRLAFDLINRQRTEIEGLKSRIFALNDTNQKLIDSQEIYWRNRVKDFAERLKENIDNGQLYVDNEDYVLTIYHISNLVKEMTEEKDNA